MLKPYRYWLIIKEDRLEIWDSQVQAVWETYSRETATIVSVMERMRELNREDNLKQEQWWDELLMSIEKEGSDTSWKSQLEAAGFGDFGPM